MIWALVAFALLIVALDAPSKEHESGGDSSEDFIRIGYGADDQVIFLAYTVALSLEFPAPVFRTGHAKIPGVLAMNLASRESGSSTFVIHFPRATHVTRMVGANGSALPHLAKNEKDATYLQFNLNAQQGCEGQSVAAYFELPFESVVNRMGWGSYSARVVLSQVPLEILRSGPSLEEARHGQLVPLPIGETFALGNATDPRQVVKELGCPAFDSTLEPAGGPLLGVFAKLSEGFGEITAHAPPSAELESNYASWDIPLTITPDRRITDLNRTISINFNHRLIRYFVGLAPSVLFLGLGVLLSTPRPRSSPPASTPKERKSSGRRQNRILS